MKFCFKCGKELNDASIICPNCGSSTDYKQNEAIANSYSQSDNLKKAAKVFMIIGCIFSAFFYCIPLIWTIPMTVEYIKKINNSEYISTTFKIFSLIFVSPIAGILMLCDKE